MKRRYINPSKVGPFICFNHGENVAQQIRKELKAAGDPEKVAGEHRYFKEPIRTYGTRAAGAHAIGRKFARQIKKEGGLGQALAVSQELIESGNLTEHSVVRDIIKPFLKQLEPKHFKFFDKWINHLTNWASVDSNCTGVIGELLLSYPVLAKKVIPWTKSRNRWRKRAAAVSLVVPARKGGNLEEIFTVAEALLTDPDNLVQKGVGWMLKEGTNSENRGKIVRFLMKHRKEMPRTMIRYACEKLDPKTRAKILFD